MWVITRFTLLSAIREKCVKTKCVVVRFYGSCVCLCGVCVCESVVALDSDWR